MVQFILMQKKRKLDRTRNCELSLTMCTRRSTTRVEKRKEGKEYNNEELNEDCRFIFKTGKESIASNGDRRVVSTIRFMLTQEMSKNDTGKA